MIVFVPVCVCVCKCGMSASVSISACNMYPQDNQTVIDMGDKQRDVDLLRSGPRWDKRKYLPHAFILSLPSDFYSYTFSPHFVCKCTISAFHALLSLHTPTFDPFSFSFLPRGPQPPHHISARAAFILNHNFPNGHRSVALSLYLLIPRLIWIALVCNLKSKFLFNI